MTSRGCFGQNPTDVPGHPCTSRLWRASQGVIATVSDLPTSSHVGHDDESAQQLLVHAAGLTLTIYPSKAAKFEAKREQDRNAHLNLRFEAGIPLDARGLFAELSGAVPMSEATRALLKPANRV